MESGYCNQNGSFWYGWSRKNLNRGFNHNFVKNCGFLDLKVTDDQPMVTVIGDDQNSSRFHDTNKMSPKWQNW